MSEPKPKPARREAGKNKFRLPERSPRVVEINPLRELLQEAKAQEEALLDKAQPPPTPAMRSAGVSETKPVQARKPTTPAKEIAGVVESQLLSRDVQKPQFPSFDDFHRRWSVLLRPGQMKVCRSLFEMSYAVGEIECFTSMPKLASAAGLKERQCYNVVAQLEQLGFIERPEIFNTPTRKGTIFRLHLVPQESNAPQGRRYHIGSEDD